MPAGPSFGYGSTWVWRTLSTRWRPLWTLLNKAAPNGAPAGTAVRLMRDAAATIPAHSHG
ncbi:hypothetical protein NOCARDAX2BIS_220170 [Nocardioides sp. AX2bis]|nr:hypothetical protein NOCARDAX2BIS_220170 [Nocardioides sp. AX2bis]